MRHNRGIWWGGPTALLTRIEAMFQPRKPWENPVRNLVLALMVLSWCCGSATAQPPAAAETAVVTGHTLTLGSATIPYQATAGTLVLRDADGMPTAEMFYCAYVVASPKRQAPPADLLFNGGPGSSSIWLHMSGLGPVAVHTNTPAPTGPAPYEAGPSPHSLLDKTDLVFLDAIGTGFSRPLGKAKGEDFWGVDADAKVFTEAITRYLTLHRR